MNLKEYTKRAQPGTRVYVVNRGVKMWGIAGRMFGSDGIELVVKFDGGIVKVNEQNVHLFNFDESN